MRTEASDLETFEAHRTHLVALGYRMLGDRARAEDMVQEAWLRWRGRRAEAEVPRAYLVATVTRLCLNELGSARVRREESRSDRLPEPIDLDDGLARVEVLEQISMAFLVALQRLTPAERAVLILHDVLDYDHAQIAAIVGRNDASCRKLLERARGSLGNEKRMFQTSREEHERLLHAFLGAAWQGDVAALTALLAEDAVMVTDGGTEGVRANGIRNLAVPLHGAAHVASFVAAVTQRNGASLRVAIRDLNGQPAMVLYEGEAPFAAMLLGVVDGRVHRVFFQADAQRLTRVGPPR